MNRKIFFASRNFEKLVEVKGIDNITNENISEELIKELEFEKADYCSDFNFGYETLTEILNWNYDLHTKQLIVDYK